MRLWRMLYTTRFWTRASIVLIICLAAVFWAKFAYIYDIPASASANSLGHAKAYVTVKDWWFGPAIFDLGTYQSYPIPSELSSNPYAVLLDNLGRYKTVVEKPNYVWVAHAGS